MSGITLAQALADAAQQGADRMEAQWLLAQVVGRPRSWLLAHDDALLSADQHREWQTLLTRCLASEPLAYLLGQAEFHGLLLQVSPDVLIPRSDTETLVDWALELMGSGRLPALPEVLDLGTGSGAIALAVKAAVPMARVMAVDASPAALQVARANARRLSLDVDWRQGDWWQAVDPAPLIHLALSNPPYIAEGDPHLPALRHEPAMALSSGPEGMNALTTIVSGAPDHLAPGGWLLLEHGFDQAERVRLLLSQHGFREVQTRVDLGGRARCSGGRLDAPT
jgi:release factor glutamine methyltransferase